MRKGILAIIFMIVIFANADASYAILVDSEINFPTSKEVIDFSQFSGSNTYGPGPIQVGQLVNEDITWSANNSGSLIVGNPLTQYGFVANGVWKNGKTFAGVNGQPDNVIYSMRFDFNDGPVSFVGGFLNYVPNGGSRFTEARITALGRLGNTLETYDLITDAPISTPSAINDGAFRGIERSDNDIYAFELKNSVLAIDDFTFSRIGSSTVPEPSSLLLMGFGGIITAFIKRRRKA